jgi:hypothetical protein
MNAIFLLVLLQFNLFGPSPQALNGANLSVVNTVDNEIVAFQKIGQSGDFEFSNLDAGNYILLVEIPENSVKTVDKRTKHKYESEIETGYNIDKEVFMWQHPDGYIELKYKRLNRIAEPLEPVFEPVSTSIAQCNNNNDKSSVQNEESTNQDDESTLNKYTILRFTVISEGGRMSGSLKSVSQKSFFKLMVGNDDIKYEDSGKVKVLSNINQ